MSHSSHTAAGTRQVARGGLANLVGAGYSGVASFAITALVTRIATKEDAGVYFSAVSLALMVVALAQLGIPVGYVYFLARFRALGRTASLRRVITAGAAPVVVLSLVLTLIVVLMREPLADLLLGEGVEGRVAIMLILAGVPLIAIAGDSALGATRGLGVMRPTVVVDKFVNPTVQLLALLLLAVVGWTGADGLIWTRVVGFVVVALVAMPWLMRLLRRFPAPVELSRREAWTPDKALAREFWGYTGPRALGQVAQVIVQRVDIVLVALWLSPAEAAVYAAATRFLVFGQLAGRSIGMAVQPQISKLAARGDMRPLQHLYRTSTAWVIFATWPFYLTFIVHADWLMQVFGDDYGSGALVLQVLSMAMLVGTACGAVDAVLLMAGRSDLTMINAWVALVVNVGLNLWLIPTLGILGAALAWCAAILTTNIVPLIQVEVTLDVHPFGRITMLAVLLTGVLFGLVPWLVQQAGGGLTGAVIGLALGVVVYVVPLWRLREVLGLTGLFRRGRV